MAERRISTPLVLAAASSMIALGAVVLLNTSDAETGAEQATDPAGLHIDDSTPENAAESFYDAWRRRRWSEAERVSTGHAHRAVLQKQAADEAMDRDERIIAERGWEALAQAPLNLALGEVEIEDGERYTLRGVAEYRFVGSPYRREVTLYVHGTSDGYRVSRMDLGEVLTELPAMFRGDVEP